MSGLAERYIQAVKQFLKKAADSGEGVYQALLAYRQAPLLEMRYSPADMLFNRSIRSVMPCTSETLQPYIPDAVEMLKQRQTTQKEQHDNHSRPLTALHGGNRVLMRTDNQADWTAGKVISQHQSPCSYLVDNGMNIVRRNRVHLKPDHTPDSPRVAGTSPAAAQQNVVRLDISHEPSDPNGDATTPRRSIRESRGTLRAVSLTYSIL